MGQYLTSANIIIVLLVLIFIIKPVIRAIVKAAKKSAKKPHVAVVSIDGVIRYSDKEDKNFSRWREDFEEIEKEIKPQALIVRINSPGGTVAGSQELFSIIQRMTKKMPVYAVFEDVAASGGLYIAMAATRIISHAGTVTGSIGVIVQTWDVSSILNWLGIVPNTIKSGSYKDILSPIKPMSTDERNLLNEIVMNTYTQFCNVIMTARNIDSETLKTFADGRIMNGEQALKYGLIDEIGSLETALQHAAQTLGIERDKLNIEVVEHKQNKLERIKRLIFSSRIVSNIQAFLPDKSLSGVPLWLFKQ